MSLSGNQLDSISNLPDLVPKRPSSEESALELMLAKDRLSIDLGKGPADAMPGGSRGKGGAAQKRDAKDELQEMK
jgi:hypothetical protein